MNDRSSRNSINDVESIAWIVLARWICIRIPKCNRVCRFWESVKRYFIYSAMLWTFSSPSSIPPISPLTFFSRRMQLLRFHLQERVITISGPIIINNNEFDAYSRLLPSSIFLRSLVVDIVYFLTLKNDGSANDVIFRMENLIILIFKFYSPSSVIIFLFKILEQDNRILSLQHL